MVDYSHYHLKNFYKRKKRGQKSGGYQSFVYEEREASPIHNAQFTMQNNGDDLNNTATIHDARYTMHEKNNPVIASEKTVIASEARQSKTPPVCSASTPLASRGELHVASTPLAGRGELRDVSHDNDGININNTLTIDDRRQTIDENTTTIHDTRYTIHDLTENRQPSTVNCPPSTVNPKKCVDKKALVAAALIVICFALVVVLGEVFSGGIILAGVRQGASQTDTYFILVSGGFSERAQAVAESNMVNLRGGAGTIFTQNGEYFVAVATYLTKNDAEAVQQRNADFTIITKTINIAESANAVVNETVAQIKTAIEEIDRITIDFANEKMSEREVIASLNVIRTNFFDVKQSLFASGLTGDMLRRLVVATDPFFAGIDGIIRGAGREPLVAGLRRIVAEAVLAVC
jgi:hypothetical protein